MEPPKDRRTLVANVSAVLQRSAVRRAELRRKKKRGSWGGSALWRCRRASGEGLGDDQSSLVEAGVGDGREQRDGGDDGEKLLHCSAPCFCVDLLT